MIWGIALNKLLSQREKTPFLVILDKVRDRRFLKYIVIVEVGGNIEISQELPYIKLVNE